MAVNETLAMEVEIVHELLEQLDYYQLLKVERGAGSSDIQAAFFRESRLYHPDRYFGVVEAGFKEKLLEIYKRLTEAYGVLKDPETRSVYNRQLEADQGLRIDRTAVEAAQRLVAMPETIATTLQGRKFMVMGLEALQHRDSRGATLHFQCALSREPGNQGIQEYLEVARRMADEIKRAARP